MQDTLNQSKSSYQRLRSNSLLLLLGGISTLGFAPFKLYPITIFAYAILYNSSNKNSFWFFLGQAIFGCYWLFFSIKNYGMLPLIPALSITAIALTLIAAIPALMGRMVRNKYKMWLWPIWLTSSEIIRSYFLFSGFPWLLLSYTQIHSPWHGWLAIIGVHGTSLLLSFVIASFMEVFKRGKIFLIPSIIWLISIFVLPSNWTQAEVVKLHFQAKHSKNHYEPFLTDLSQSTNPVDFVLWPEGVIHHTLSEYEQDILKKFSRQHLTIFGGLSQANSKLYNSTIALHANGSISTHKKYNLVAFGEYWPLKSIYEKFYTVPNNLSPANNDNQKLIPIKNTFILPIICYDIAFAGWLLPDIIQAGLLVSIHQMRWFNSRLAVSQQLELAQARSIEFGRPQIFLEPSFGHIIIQPNGELAKNNFITAYKGRTPYASLLLYLQKISGKL